MHTALESLQCQCGRCEGPPDPQPLWIQGGDTNGGKVCGVPVLRVVMHTEEDYNIKIRASGLLSAVTFAKLLSGSKQIWK